ncbi:MAG TPA: 30S ribosomal protein S5 [Pontiella sp.]
MAEQQRERKGRQGGRGRKGRRDENQEVREKPEFEERVVHISRNSKVVKGGRRFSFGALVVVGDRKGRVGYGLGKAAEVSEAIRKASDSAKRDLQTITMRGTTLPHDAMGKYSGAQVLIRPASEGTGIIAGGPCRAVLELAGVRDVLAKSLGSNNHLNVTKATLKALSMLRSKQEALAIRKG